MKEKKNYIATEADMLVIKAVEKLKDIKKIRTNKAFFSEFGLSNESTISSIMSGKIGVPRKYLSEMNKVWGDYLNENFVKNGENNARPVHDFTYSLVPLVDSRAQAGYPSGFSDTNYIKNLPTIYVKKPQDDGLYMVFEVMGESMDDGTSKAVLDGDKYLCKELTKDFWGHTLFTKKYLFILVLEDGIICKRILKHDVESGELVCQSFNPAYKDEVHNISEVKQIFYMVELVSRKPLVS